MYVCMPSKDGDGSSLRARCKCTLTQSPKEAFKSCWKDLTCSNTLTSFLQWQGTLAPFQGNTEAGTHRNTHTSFLTAASLTWAKVSLKEWVLDLSSSIDPTISSEGWSFQRVWNWFHQSIVLPEFDSWFSHISGFQPFYSPPTHEECL